MISAMNYAASKGMHKMTLKGKGWNSNGYGALTRPKMRATYQANSVGIGEELKRPKSIKTRLHSLDEDVQEKEKPPMRVM
jgi:hypothetical protein